MLEAVTCSPPIKRTVETGTTVETLATDARNVDAIKEGWQCLIDYFLVEWGKDPLQLEDQEEGIVAPSRRAIQIACNLARFMRDEEEPAPTRVVPDGDGGISFERHDADLFFSLDIHADLTVELVTFRDCQLVSRRRLLLT